MLIQRIKQLIYRE